HGLNWTDGNELERLMAMVGGHPYLVRLALYHLVGKGGLERDLGQILEQAPTETGIYNEHLRQYLLALIEERELEAAFYEVITTPMSVKLEPVLAYKLQNMGLINLEGDRAYPACELYRLYFREQLNTRRQLENAKQEQIEKENQLHLLSSLDRLTQLANRRYFNTYLQMEWQRSARNHSFFSLILCNIDNFNIYNKMYGITAGDDCLRQIAYAIRNCVRRLLSNSSFSYASSFKITTQTTDYKYELSSVLAARYSNEEFAILTQGDGATAIHIAEKIREQIKALAIPFEYPGSSGLMNNVLTVSLGVASMISENEKEPSTLVVAAEKALFQAKTKGRDCVILN
ncbi:MAG: AAA-like domain-containing protein, partial [Rhizonema sp. PD38]|nr:AAA-like domain-containing protein [Rhizonema sp. PD38]